MLTSEKHPHPLVFMTGVGHEVLGAVLNFMYCGEASIKNELMNLFMKFSIDIELLGVTAETLNEITWKENKKKSKHASTGTRGSAKIKTVNMIIARKDTYKLVNTGMKMGAIEKTGVPTSTRKPGKNNKEIYRS